MAFHPYLNFDGNCREAFTRYQEIFGGELFLLQMSDMPGDEPTPPGQADLILHAALMFTSAAGDHLLMASDSFTDDFPRVEGMYVAYTDVNGTEDDNVAANNHSVIKVARSRDGGATWAVSTPHSMADVSTVDRFNQWLSVDNNGRVFVMYYDTRHSSGRTGTDIYYAVSTDGAPGGR